MNEIIVGSLRCIIAARYADPAADSSLTPESGAHASRFVLCLYSKVQKDLILLEIRVFPAESTGFLSCLGYNYCSSQKSIAVFVQVALIVIYLT